MNRKNFLITSGLATLALGSGLAGTLFRDNATSERGHRVTDGARRFPNPVLQTHNDRKVRFYDDLVKDKIVLIDLIDASGSDISERQTENLARLTENPDFSRLLGKHIFMYSIAVDAWGDAQARLKRYARRHGAQPNWLFLTGKSEDLRKLRHSLGMTGPGMVVYGNETLDRWRGCPSLTKPNLIAQWLLNDMVPKDLRAIANASHGNGPWEVSA